MAQSRHSQQLRIIGGRWRRRKLSFPDVPGIRPTPDRVRETLFNWLIPVIEGARCLDLFAGSGALGLEALSRGASAVVMVDQDARVIGALRAHLQLLQADGARVVQAGAMDFLQGEAMPFDIVFLDPPFKQSLIPKILPVLATSAWLAAGARVYMESEARISEADLPAGWVLTHSKQAGQVHYHLAYCP